jgi:hypothetical protein
MEIKFNRKNESTVERFIYRYRLTGFLLKDCRNDNLTHLIQYMAVIDIPIGILKCDK